jgi:putative transcriptional regulator
VLRPAPGRLLVATPVIGDPNFERTVVLLIEHDAAGGTVGLVLNRPTDTALLDPMPEWQRLAAHPPVVFGGGPVEPDRAFCLARSRPGKEADDRFDPIVGNVGTLDLNVDPDTLGSAIDEVRIFAGCAGWGPGQLGAELEAGAWWVVEGSADDPVDTEPDRLWRTVLARQPSELQLFADYPTDPGVN